MSETKEASKVRGKWTTTNIISVIVGMIVFWPVGLFLLVWVLMDRDVVELANMIRSESSKLVAKIKNGKSASGNRVFDEFQQTQLDRIKEIKGEMKERYQAFQDYKEERDRSVEESEFEEFMKQKPAVKETVGESVKGTR